MAYKWTKKRKEAKKRLTTFAIYFVLLTGFEAATGMLTAVTHSTQHHSFSFALLVVLNLYFYYMVAQDIYTLLLDDSDDDKDAATEESEG